jgi:hypothetical protein
LIQKLFIPKKNLKSNRIYFLFFPFWQFISIYIGIGRYHRITTFVFRRSKNNNYE